MSFGERARSVGEIASGLAAELFCRGLAIRDAKIRSRLAPLLSNGLRPDEILARFDYAAESAMPLADEFDPQHFSKKTAK
jgi:hypothetical protein